MRPVVLVAVLVGVKTLVHALVLNRFGYHGDELYFIECGRHLAAGYVDHSPLVPWLARATEFFGANLVTLRLPVVAASAGTMVMTALLVKEWGGGGRAQTLALLSLLTGPMWLRMGTMLNIPVFEVFFCTTAASLVVRALRTGALRWWLAVGVLCGLALLTKHTVLLWGFGLAVGLLVARRSVLLTPGPWVALAIAVMLFTPNLLWQAEHGFATLEFGARLREQVLEEQGRALFAAAQLLYLHPLVAPVWVAGLAFSLTAEGSGARPFAALFVVMFGALLIVGGKPYYLASAYPPVLALGGVALERWWANRVVLWRALVVSIGTTGVGLALMTLPVLPIRTIDGVLESLLGWAVPPMGLTHDLHGELGWNEHVSTIDRVLATLTPEERAGASVLTGSYSQAAALNVLRSKPSPTAMSGQMNYWLWGPQGEGRVLIAYGVSLPLLKRHFSGVEEIDRIVAPLARPWDTDLPVYLCREPVGDLATLWPELRRFDHRRGTP